MASDASLPGDYRSRMRQQRDLGLEQVIERASAVLTSSPDLAQIISRHNQHITLVDPYWPVPDTARSLRRHAGQPGLRIAWLGTRSHLTDFELAKPALLAFLERFPKARLEVFFGKQPPASIQTHPQIVNRPMLPWRDHVRRLKQSQFDAAIYTIADSPSNRSRSINKFLEHASAGAVSVFSNDVPFRQRLEPGRDCIVTDFDTLEEELVRLQTHSALRARLAQHAMRKASEIASLSAARQLTFWRQQFDQ